MAHNYLEAIANAWRKCQLASTSAHVKLGHAAHRYLLTELRTIRGAGERRRARANAILAACAHIQATSSTAPTVAQLNRAIQAYHVAQIYGTSATSLPLHVLKSFAATLKRRAKDETWHPKGKIEDASRALWQRLVEKELPATAASSEIAAILGKQPRQPHPLITKDKRVLRLISSLTRDQQEAIHFALGKLLEASQEPIPTAPHVDDLAHVIAGDIAQHRIPHQTQTKPEHKPGWKDTIRRLAS